MAESADSDSETGKHDRSTHLERTKPWDTAEDVPWTLLKEGELADAYDAVVAPARRRDGFDATDRPSYEWLSNHGFRALTYTLREHHDTTLAVWWDEHVGEDSADGYEWAIDDDRTRESMRDYLDAKQADRDAWSETTRQTIRTRLNTYGRCYRAKHGDDALVAEVEGHSDDVDETAAVDRCRATFRWMRSNGYADRTIARVHDAVRDWYGWLDARAVAAVNPTNGADDWFGWNRSGETDPTALDADHVRQLWTAATTTRERMLVVALCAWGLRSNEVASLHANQLVLDENPRVEFDERKNGPSTVAIVHGDDIARDRMAATTDYLFPSNRSQTGHISRSTVANRFHDLADRAGVPETIGGNARKPHMARRFWYEAYSATIEDILEHVAEIADEQGSASAQVVRDDYLSAERRRELRREFMAVRLADVFEVES